VTSADDFVIRLVLERGLLQPDHVATARLRAAELPAGTTAPAFGWRSLAGGSPAAARAIARALAAEFGLPFVELPEQPPPPDALAALPRSYATRHRVCPAGWHNGTLQVAVADPLDLAVLDGLEHTAGRPVQICVAAESDILRALTLYYRDEAGAGEDPVCDPEPLTDAGAPPTDAVPAAEPSGSEVTESDAPIIKLVHDLIVDAVRRRASDLHLEPLAGNFRVRHRIDGVMVEAAALAKRLQPAIISRLKIMANISIAERRVPQDGRIQIALDGRPLDLRVSSLPTAHGESLVLRVLDQQGLRLGLSELGFGDEDREMFTRLLASPDGILLVTGPTGSGKTTTLYSCLHHLNQPDCKIITVEEPVEYQIGGINQVPVRTDIGMTFASALRAMLRQAPNIVMVGEIRDRETAEVSLNAALTGHLVFSTLHTNDAPGAVTRLIDLGSKPFLVAAALRATVAQRLVRRICPHCRRAHVPSPRELRLCGLSSAQAADARFARGAGCAACHGTGYLGRLGIFEIFLITDAIRTLIGENASGARLRAQARRDGGRSLRDDGVRKVLAGSTTIEEVASATAGDID
jgi:general secretion pathway protein E/type IV pilus assembly protein PilB